MYAEVLTGGVDRAADAADDPRHDLDAAGEEQRARLLGLGVGVKEGVHLLRCKGRLKQAACHDAPGGFAHETLEYLAEGHEKVLFRNGGRHTGQASDRHEPNRRQLSWESIRSPARRANAASIDPARNRCTLDHIQKSVSFSHALGLDQSPGSQQSGDPALVYNSDTVSQQPIIQVQLNTPNNASLPSSIQGDLTFNGTAARTVTYNTTGFTPGDTLTMALQASTAITTTGGYSWSVSVTAGSFSHTYTGYTFVVAQDSSTLGAGWSFAGVNQLVPISASGSVPAGVLMVFGTGGWRFYQGTSSFTSPAGDNGTLTLSGGTYTYSTPDGESWTYNSSGLMTQWTSPDGQETLHYRYDGSNRLDGITAIDGAVTTFVYSSGQVLIETVNSRVTTLTLDGSDNLTEITDPNGAVQTISYDGNHHLTGEQVGLLGNAWGYSSAGVLATMTLGTTSVSLGPSPSENVLEPALAAGLTSLVAGNVAASETNADGAVMQVLLDSQGRPLAIRDADGGETSMTYSNGFLSSETDPLGRTTTYTLDSAGYVTAETLPDGSVVTYQYQTAYHALTTMTDERAETTTYAYDSSGHLTGTTDALGKHTTLAYYSNGLLESVADANNHTATYTYDTDRRQSTIEEPTGATTTLGYDANGNLSTINAPVDGVTTIVNDVMGQVLNTINPQGGTTTMTWDVSGLQLSSTDEMGVTTSYIYDAYNRGLLVETIVGVGSAVPVTALASYDAAEQLISTRDANGATTTYVYDPAGNVISTTDGLGNTSQNDYDLAHELTATRDPMGNWTQYSYNSRGWLTQVRDALGNVSTLAYDAAGNETAVTDPLGHTSTFTYDAVGQQTVAEDPLGHLVTTTYDPVGNISRLDECQRRDDVLHVRRRQSADGRSGRGGHQRTAEPGHGLRRRGQRDDADRRQFARDHAGVRYAGPAHERDRCAVAREHPQLQRGQRIDRCYQCPEPHGHAQLRRHPQPGCCDRPAGPHRHDGAGRRRRHDGDDRSARQRDGGDDRPAGSHRGQRGRAGQCHPDGT